MADTLHTVAEALTAGERISGPAAPRLVAAAAEFDERYGGKMLTERQYRALRRHSPLQVFDNPAQFLICNYDPLQLRPATRALCEDRRLHCQRANPRPGRLPTRLRQHCPNRHSHPRPTGPCARVAGPSRLGTAARAHASAAPSTDRPP
jgi:hypothetical protein